MVDRLNDWMGGLCSIIPQYRLKFANDEISVLKGKQKIHKLISVYIGII